MKNCYISCLYDGQRVDDIFLVYSKSLGYTQDGSPFVRFKLGDRTGTIDAIKWDTSEAASAAVNNDEYIRIRGSVTTYNGRLQLKIESFRPHREKVDPTDFMPRSSRDIDEMIFELKDIISTISNPQLKALLSYFFDDDEFMSRFSTAPAALKIHHAYIGGLIEHSISVARMCDFAASHYTGVDRDLLITGAVLHDVGKINEFCWDKSIKYSDNGHLIGHIAGGASMLEKAIDSIEGFHPLLKMVLIHIILSHHGEREFGSPKRPKCIEGIILHFLEDLDAKVNTFKQAIGTNTPEKDGDIWTDRHWIFDRPLFRGFPKTSIKDEDELIDDYDPFADV